MSFPKAVIPCRLILFNNGASIKEQKRGSALKLLISVVAYKSDSARVSTDPIEVDQLAMVRFRFQCSSFPIFKMDVDVAVKASQRATQQANQSIVKVKINLNTYEKEVVCADCWSEFLSLGGTEPDFEIGPNQNPNGYVGLSSPNIGVQKGVGIYLFTLEVNITVQDVTHSMNANPVLLNDTNFLDLNLIASDGSPPVKVHRVVMASHSERFRTLLTDPNKASERDFPIGGVTYETLKQLRDYMYTGSLPLSGLPQLLVLAIHSEMNKLKDDCIRKLTSMVDGNDLDNVIDFAIEHRMPELLIGILSFTSDSAIHRAHQLRKHKLVLRTNNLPLPALGWTNNGQ